MEFWAFIPGFGDRYQVSNLGRVRSIGVRGQYLKPQRINSGYLSVHLSLGARGKRKAKLLHRLVAEEFIRNPERRPEVNHKDRNRLNNCEANLEWATRQENVTHGPKPVGSGCAVIGSLMPSGQPMFPSQHVWFPSQSAAERALSPLRKNTGAISGCLKGKMASAYGFTWERA